MIATKAPGRAANKKSITRAQKRIFNEAKATSQLILISIFNSNIILKLKYTLILAKNDLAVSGFSNHRGIISAEFAIRYSKTYFLLLASMMQLLTNSHITTHSPTN